MLFRLTAILILIPSLIQEFSSQRQVNFITLNAIYIFIIAICLEIIASYANRNIKQNTFTTKILLLLFQESHALFTAT